MVGAGPFPALAESDLAAKAFPPVLERAGRVACFAADEFFSARISNSETRRAYARAVAVQNAARASGLDGEDRESATSGCEIHLVTPEEQQDYGGGPRV